jgi:DHA2 family multidrug resistance protein-like MFS transporter
VTTTSPTPANSGPDPAIPGPSNAAPMLLSERPEVYARRWFLLGVMCLSLVMVVMAVSGLNVALPSIQRSLGASATDLQWIVDAYAIVFAGLLLTAGSIGDRYGRKTALQCGLVLFGAGSLFGVFAGSVPQVIGARVVMGVGAAFIMPATLSIITAVFPPQERQKAIAVWAGFAGAGSALGPLVVGFLLTDWWVFPSHWWGAAFVVNVVGVIVVLVAVTIYAPQSKDDSATPLDPGGAVFSVVGFAALLYGIIEGPIKGWTSTEVLVAFAISAAGLVGFVLWERRQRHPLLPMDLFRIPRFSVGAGVITFAFFVMFGFFFLISQFLQNVRGYSPLDAGVATLPFAATLILVSPRSAAIAARVGYTKVVACGFAFIVAGFLVFTQVDAASPYLVILAGLIVLGVGMGITVAPSTGSIMRSVPLNKAGVGSAVNDTTREVGGALGIAVLGSIVNSVYRSNIDATVIGRLPGDAGAAATQSVGAAIQVSGSLPTAAGNALADTAQTAFTTAFNTALGAAAVVAAVIGVTVLLIGRRIERTGAAERSS